MMLRPEKMWKVGIIAHKKHKKRIIETLYSLGVLHIREYSPGEFELGKPLENAEEIARVLLKVRNVLSKLPKVGSGKERRIANLREGEKICDALAEKIEALQTELKEKEAKLSRLKKLEEINSYLKKLGVSPEVFWESKAVEIIFGTAKKFNEHLLTGVDFLVFRHARIRKDEHVLFLAVRKDELEKLGKILGEMEFTEIDKALVTELAEINVEREIKETRKKIKEISKALEKLAKEYRKSLESFRAFLEEEAEKAEAPLKFAESKNAIFIQGWVPEENKEELARKIDEVCKGKVFIKLEEAKRKEERTPVKLSHPKLVDNFRTFLEMYSLPKYSEIDPTFFMFLTFPLYFGFMLGDVGYGIVTLIIALFMRKANFAKNLANVLILASLSSIAFGFIYGEFFGAEKILGIELPHLIARIHSINELLVASVIFGLIHVNLGLILGFVNEYVAHGLKAAVFEKASWLVVELGGLLFFLYWKGILEINPLIPAGIFLLGVAMLVKGEGFLGVVEIPTLLSHILSFSRLMGVGIASASLALVINEIAGGLIEKGALFFPVAVILLLVGHAVNIGLGLMECSLHSLRLNWVEFFTKFYKGGGTRYTPFGKRK